MERANDQHRRMLEKLVGGWETEKTQLRCAKEAELRELDARRKREAEEFMTRNKDYLLTHLSELKQLQANYEAEIR